MTVRPDHHGRKTGAGWAPPRATRLQAHIAALAAEHSPSAIQAKLLIQLDPGWPLAQP